MPHNTLENNRYRLVVYLITSIRTIILDSSTIIPIVPGVALVIPGKICVVKTIAVANKQLIVLPPGSTMELTQ